MNSEKTILVAFILSTYSLKALSRFLHFFQTMLLSLSFHTENQMDTAQIKVEA